MNPKSLPTAYFNNVLFELEKAFYDERGKGARFRVTTVGRGYYAEKCRPRIQSGDLAHIVGVIENALCEDGILTRITAGADEKMLQVRVEGCVHRPIEEKMIAAGVEPFTCLPVNMIVLAIEEVLDKPVELAEIKLVDGACQLLLILFDKRPTLE